MIQFFRSRYNAILAAEPEMLNKARIRILAMAFSAFIILCVILLTLYLFQERNFLLIRMVVLLTLFTTGMMLLLYGISWRAVGHFFILCISFIIWSNVVFFKQGVNMVTIQYTLLIVSGGYYILGIRWGMIYSLINILPIIGFVLFAKYTNFSMSIFNQNVNTYAFNIVLVFNFILLVCIHYYFFKAFKKTNKKEQDLKAHLRTALKAAQEIAYAKTNFLSTMSHELRTPLNAVVGMTNILLMNDPKEEQREDLEILRFSAENLMAIINDILDFNKIDNGNIELKNELFRLDEIIKNVCGAFKAQAEAKKINFDCFTDPAINNLQLTGDQTSLTQILFNLVGNAIKFTDQGSVVMESRIKAREGDALTIFFKIEDTGIGIAQDQQASIFEPFMQTQARSRRQYHGTGLGLTIANRLVALHGSKLQLLSVEGKGTVFTFELTYRAVAEAAPVLPEQRDSLAEAPHKALRVLIAEDNAVNVLVLKKLLNKWNIEPVVVENGKKAVEAVQADDFDVVLMDINMPVMDGFEASKNIRELPDPKKASLHIIAVTASIGVAIEHHEGYQYLNDCILKPFKPEQLKDKLDSLQL